MTRSTRSLLSIVAVVGALGALAPVAGADYSSVNSLVGGNDQGSGYSSPNAILADAGDAAGPRIDEGFASVSSITGGEPVASPDEGTFATVSSITGSDPVTVSPPQLASSPPDEGFDWGDASIGAAIGVSLAALLGLALMATRRRQRTAVQPSG
jgi:hypothetical protein